LKIYNPKKFKCTACGTPLSFDKIGTIAVYSYTVIGVIMLALYIYLQNAHIGTPLGRGAIFFGYLTPATIIYYWVLFKKTRIYANKT